jgi:hypothetical protein
MMPENRPTGALKAAEPDLLAAMVEVADEWDAWLKAAREADPYLTYVPRRASESVEALEALLAEGTDAEKAGA